MVRSRVDSGARPLVGSWRHWPASDHGAESAHRSPAL